jgi:hypothetical protein
MARRPAAHERVHAAILRFFGQVSKANSMPLEGRRKVFPARLQAFFPQPITTDVVITDRRRKSRTGIFNRTYTVVWLALFLDPIDRQHAST